MKLKDLDRLIAGRELLERKISDYESERIIVRTEKEEFQISGHMAKAEHNLKFVKDNIGLGYFDWCITGCYYAVYHAALSLIISKGYYSKSHDATICVLIREFYRHGITQEDILLINRFFLDYQDIVFYVQSKNRREKASYSSSYYFDKAEVEELRLKAILFVNKAKEILKSLKVLDR
jgi:uncharacterized protein (UPF0332 family)